MNYSQEFQVQKFFEPSQDVIKMIAKNEFLYIAYSYEIIVLSIKRLTQRKDIIKKKINIPKFQTFDTLTSAFNDNEQTKFIALAYREDSYPILYSSNLEKRIISLNSEQPQIKDFYVMEEQIIVLWNNGALVIDQQLMFDNVKAISCWNNNLAVYRNNELLIGNIKLNLNQEYKDEMIYAHSLLVLYNSSQILIYDDKNTYEIPFPGALQIEIIDEDTLYILCGTQIQSLKIKSQEKQIKLQLTFMSKFYPINEQDFLFKNGNIMISNKWSKINRVISVCKSYNQILEFACLKEQVGQSINCIIMEKDPQELFRLMIQPQLNSNFQQPLNINDFKIYYYYIKKEIMCLEIAKQLYEKKNKVQDQLLKQYKFEDLQKATGKAILNLLMLMEQHEVYKDFYNHIYITYLESIKPTNDKIKIQIAAVKNKFVPSLLRKEDICPICKQQLITWVTCPTHRFIRCQTTIEPVYLQQLFVCKGCDLQSIESIKVCPVCGCEMKRLLKQ
ncbi:unnamed protein product [Paramecium primaurelia]|uniref:Uncharacterized protein n=1 Tax=Paramecium primaurelia TaxID=5886 RepID=A0A8S1MML0_PARPR|nr:unnamed protein product [Paramecium primaurelia]